MGESEIVKSKLQQNSNLLKSDAARNFLAKRQEKRGGIGNGMYKTVGRTVTGEKNAVQKADGRVRTIQDLIDFHYGFVPSHFAKQHDNGMAKADDPMLSDTPGVNNVFYGSDVYSLLNDEANPFALLEKRPWRKSGERIITDRGQALGSGGVPENAELPDTHKPDFEEFEQDVKTVSHTFDVSQVEDLLADTEDDRLQDPFDWLRTYFGTGTEQQNGMGQHPLHMTYQLMADANDGAAGDNIQSIDRVISNAAEATSILDSPDLADVYGFQRDNNEFESNVIHNGGSNRAFTADLLDDAIKAVKKASGKNPVTDPNYFWLTNHDTFQRIEDEFGGKERLEAQRATVGLNGVNTNAGDDVGITVNSYKDIPVFSSQTVTEDGIGRAYLIDSSTMFMKQLLPTQFYSTGVGVNDDPFSINRLGNEGMYVTLGELTCTVPTAHAKVRDLK